MRSITRLCATTSLVLAHSSVLGCGAPSSSVPQHDVSRPLCGWKDYRTSAPTVVVAPHGRVHDARGSVVALRADDATPFGVVVDAVGARPELVRLDVVFEGRWILPVTYVGEPLRPPKPRPEEEVAIVGHRKVIRDKGAPRVRVADVRLHRGDDAAMVELFIESSNPGGRRHDLDELAVTLRALEPPVEAFLIHADDDVPWRDVKALLRTTGCYDRAPGDEPHELLWDERQRP